MAANSVLSCMHKLSNLAQASASYFPDDDSTLH